MAPAPWRPGALRKAMAPTMAALSLLLILLCVAAPAAAFQDPPPAPDDSDEELARKWGFDWAFSGISTFAHLPHRRCLAERDQPFDIGIVGVPFDTAVSYRPGARFGPRAIRAASARQTPFRGYNHRAGINPYASPFRIVDCGDIPVVPFDNAVALRQMTEAYEVLGRRPTAAARRKDGADGGGNNDGKDSTAEEGSGNVWAHPRILSLGGDHSIALAALRGLRRTYGEPMTLIHFDAHLDTWHPAKYPAAWPSEQAAFTHGNMFWIASQEGLIANGTGVHAGLRTRLAGVGDYDDDDGQGFARIHADDIDDEIFHNFGNAQDDEDSTPKCRSGPAAIVKAILDRVGTERPVYLSLDIDVLDPGLCPGTGTPEPGGWTSRELIRILRGLAPLNVVGADVVEVAPAYDGPGEQTSLVAAQVAYEIITSWVIRGTRDTDWVAEDMSRAEKLASGGNRDPAKDEL